MVMDKYPLIEKERTTNKFIIKGIRSQHALSAQIPLLMLQHPASISDARKAIMILQSSMLQ